MTITKAFDIFTINLNKNKELEQDVIEYKVSKDRKTECHLNEPQMTSESNNSKEVTEASSSIHIDTYSREDSSSSTRKSLIASPSQRILISFTEGSTIPSRFTTGAPCRSQTSPIHRTSNRTTDRRASTEITQKEQTPISVYCLTSAASLQPQHSLNNSYSEDNTITGNEHIPMNLYCSTLEPSPQSQHSTQRSYSEDNTRIENEHFAISVPSPTSQVFPQSFLSPPESIPKSLECLSLSTVGPPPLYEPSFRYEPPGFYEPPPPYTSSSLDLFPVDFPYEIVSPESLENENNKHFRVELIRFTALAFMIILGIYMIGLIKKK